MFFFLPFLSFFPFVSSSLSFSIFLLLWFISFHVIALRFSFHLHLVCSVMPFVPWLFFLILVTALFSALSPLSFPLFFLLWFVSFQVNCSQILISPLFALPIYISVFSHSSLLYFQFCLLFRFLFSFSFGSPHSKLTVFWFFFSLSFDLSRGFCSWLGYSCHHSFLFNLSFHLL